MALTDSRREDRPRSPSVWLPATVTPEQLTPRQLATSAELAQLDPQLAGLFRYGHALVRQPDHPGAVYLLAHAGRELGRGIVRLFSGLDSPTENVDDLENARNRETIAAVLQLPSKHASVTRWFNLNKSFADSAHFREPAPPFENVVDAFLEISDLLYGRVAPYFATHAELQKLMSIEEPSADDAERARSILVRSTQRQYFFSSLEHPGWLQPLAESSYFAVPPDVIALPDGRLQTQPWPEGNYLVKVARREPKRVAELLGSINPGLKNPTVWRAVVEAASQMPGVDARSLVPSLLRALKNAEGVHLFSHFAVDLVRHLAIEREPSAFELAAALLWTVKPTALSQTMEEVEPADRRILLGRGRRETEWMLARISSYDLGLFCKDVVPTLHALSPTQTLQLLADRLDRTVFMGNSEASAAASFVRRSSWWCADLDHLDRAEDVRAQLGVSTNRVACAMAAQDASSARAAWEILKPYSADVFERIRLNVLATAGGRLQGELDAAVGGDELLNPAFGAREAANLLRKQFGAASPTSRRIFRYALERGPAPDHIESVLAMSRFEDDDEPVDDFEEAARQRKSEDEMILDVIGGWQRPRVRWFHEAIPVELRELSDRLGIVANVPSARQQAIDEGRSYGEFGWVKAKSPTPPKAVEDMTPKELVDYLLSGDWRDPAEDDDEPSRRGMYQALSAYAIADGERAVAAIDLALSSSMPEETVATMLAGLGDAVKAGKPIPWPEVLRIAQMVASSVDFIAAVRSELEREGDMSENDDDETQMRRDPVAPLQALAKAAASLVEQGCALNLIPVTLSNEVWDYAGESVRSEVTWIDTARPVARPTFARILSDSLNDLGAVVTGTLIDVALWDYRRLTQTVGKESNDAVVPEVAEKFSALGQHILQRRGRSALAAHAKLGTYLPHVRLLAPDWLHSGEKALFENGARSPHIRPAWGAYITHSHFYDAVFREMRCWYVAAADAAAEAQDEKEPRSEWSLTQGLAHHVLTALLRGGCNLGDGDSIVEKTFSNVPVGERAKAYWEVFRGWSDLTKPVAEEVVTRLVSFWEWRIAVLEQASESERKEEVDNGLTWFIATPFVPTNDAIRLGCRTLRLIGGTQRTPTTSWQRIRAIAEEAPEDSFELTELLVEQTLKGDYAFLPFDEAGPPLRSALYCGNESIRDRARRLVHRLGERGLFEYQQLLNAENTVWDN